METTVARSYPEGVTCWVDAEYPSPPPADAGPGGRSAVCTDPAGAQFRLWQARARLGAQVANVPGAWNFDDLHEDDASIDFYRAVFPWEVEVLGGVAVIRRPGYGDHLAATADPGIHARQEAAGAPAALADAIGSAAPAGDDTPPHWHVTSSVADRDESSEAAAALGATVLDTNDTRWALTAQVRDPAGAVFSISRFRPQG